MRAAEALERTPKATLRQIAEAAGVSLSTAHDVRQRVLRGDHPLPPRQRTAEKPAKRVVPDRPENAGASTGTGDRSSTLKQLHTDPSLRFTDAGRALLRLLEVHSTAEGRWDDLVDNIPRHCLETLAGLARSCAKDWQDFAARLHERVDCD
jgi:hypothetical protein